MSVRKSFDISESELARSKRMAERQGVSLNRYLHQAVIAANDSETSVLRLEEAEAKLTTALARMDQEVLRMRTDLHQESMAVMSAMEAQHQQVIEDNRALMAKFIGALSSILSTNTVGSSPSGPPDYSQLNQ